MVIGHRARESALLKLVNALLDGGKLSVTELGRQRATVGSLAVGCCVHDASVRQNGSHR